MNAVQKKKNTASEQRGINDRKRGERRECGSIQAKEKQERTKGKTKSKKAESNRMKSQKGEERRRRGSLRERRRRGGPSRGERWKWKKEKREE